MAVNIETRSIESSVATEIFILARPVKTAPADQQWREIFAGIKNILASREAYILQERIFGNEEAIKIAPEVRAKEYGDVDDGVEPSFLVCKEGLLGSVAGVQIHAIRCKDKPQVIDFQGKRCGRVVNVPGRKYLALSGISGSEFDSSVEQAKAMFEKSEAILKQFNSDFFDVPRTWIWLGDILSWYRQFNKVRNNFFAERDVITESAIQTLPASTGIGLAPAKRGICAMDLVAVLEPAGCIQYLSAAGRQQCAFEYGSAFSRATEAITPAAKTIFISGTASIDINGATTNIGDPLGQIKETMENIRAVLKDMHCTDNDVVQAVAYCKTAEEEKIFCNFKNKSAWPWVVAICDICRPELLFEVEVTAISPG